MKIGVNSDLNIPVRRSAPKHNFGSGAVKLPHSGVERNILKLGQAKTKRSKLKQRKRGWLRVKKEKQAKQTKQAKRRLFRLRTRTI